MATYCDGCGNASADLTQTEMDPQAHACYLCPTCIKFSPCRNHVEQPGVNCPTCDF